MFAKRTNWNLAANRLSEALAAHRAAGKPLLDLTVSNPTECGFHYDEAAILRALQNPAALKYTPDPQGLPAARDAVRQYYAARSVTPRMAAATPDTGISKNSAAEIAADAERGAAQHRGTPAIDDIFLTTSTSEAYSYVFRALCDAHDEVLIPAPSYPLFEFLADIQDVRLVRYPLVYDHGWQIDFHSLQEAITGRTRAVIVVNPNNPTGNYCQPAEMRQLNEICAARGLAIVADEVFLDFSLKGGSPASFAGNADALTFTLSGISKICGLPQMKVAWAVVSGPEPQRAPAKARLEVIADTYLSLNAPLQWALPPLLELRHGFQRQLAVRVRANLGELDRQLAKHKSVNRLEVEAGWNAVLRVPATRADDELALELLATKDVYVHPGHFYDFPSEGYLVVSLLTPEREFADGLARLLAMF